MFSGGIKSEHWTEFSDLGRCKTSLYGGYGDKKAMQTALSDKMFSLHRIFLSMFSFYRILQSARTASKKHPVDKTLNVTGSKFHIQNERKNHFYFLHTYTSVLALSPFVIALVKTTKKTKIRMKKFIITHKSALKFHELI